MFIVLGKTKSLRRYQKWKIDGYLIQWQNEKRQKDKEFSVYKHSKDKVSEGKDMSICGL